MNIEGVCDQNCPKPCYQHNGYQIRVHLPIALTIWPRPNVSFHDSTGAIRPEVLKWLEEIHVSFGKLEVHTAVQIQMDGPMNIVYVRSGTDPNGQPLELGGDDDFNPDGSSLAGDKKETPATGAWVCSIIIQEGLEHTTVHSLDLYYNDFANPDLVELKLRRHLDNLIR